MADKLATLARLRRLGVQQARRDLAEAMLAETAAGENLRLAREALSREAAIDGPPGAFAAWLPRGQEIAGRAHDALVRASRHRDAARHGFVSASRAEDAVTGLIETKAAEARRDREKREGLALGDRPARGGTGELPS